MKQGGKLVQALLTLQTNMTKVQQELESESFEGTVAGGLVRVTVTGKGELTKVTLDPEVLAEGTATVEDLVVAAFRHAHQQKEAVAKTKLAGVAGHLLPAGFNLPVLR